MGPSWSIFEGTTDAPTRVPGKFRKVASGQWYWHIRDGNNRVIAQGEGYDSEWNARRGLLNAVDAFAQLAPAFDSLKTAWTSAPD